MMKKSPKMTKKVQNEKLLKMNEKKNWGTNLKNPIPKPPMVDSSLWPNIHSKFYIFLIGKN